MLLLGGTGFVGKCILDAFAKGLLESWKIDQITVVARNAEAFPRRFPGLSNAAVKFVSADLNDIQEVYQLPSAEYILHAAASSNANDYDVDAWGQHASMLQSTKNLLQWVTDKKLRSKILYVSSGAVYGNSTKQRFSEDSFCISDVDSITGPENSKGVYRVAKIKCEYLMLQASQYFSLPVSIARCFSFVGPWLELNQHYAIGNFLEDALHGRDVQVKAQYPVYRSYMYAEDLVLWLMSLMHQASTDCRVYNVGSPYAVELHHLAQSIARRFDVGVSGLLLDVNEKLADFYVPCVDNAIRDFGLNLNYSLDAAIDATIRQVLSGCSV